MSHVLRPCKVLTHPAFGWEAHHCITPEEWRVIHLMAVTVASTHLHCLSMRHLPSFAATQWQKMSFYQHYFIKEWSQAVRELEVLASLLSYCARTWKGEKMLACILQDKPTHPDPPSHPFTCFKSFPSSFFSITFTFLCLNPWPCPSLEYKWAKGGKDITSNTEPPHELSSSPHPLFLAILQSMTPPAEDPTVMELEGLGDDHLASRQARKTSILKAIMQAPKTEQPSQDNLQGIINTCKSKCHYQLSSLGNLIYCHASPVLSHL
ncbi:hypothetical protein V8E53_011815 [Lactarius tabidus]